MAGPGNWYLRSKKDPRWDATGRGFVNILHDSTERDRKVEELKNLFGNPPDDLERSFERDRSDVRMY